MRLWKRVVLVFFGLGMLAIILMVCWKSPKVFELRASDEIWVITDTHHLSPKLQDGGSAFQRIQATAAGKELRYGYERLEALRHQIAKEKPKALLISGDLTFNGEYASALELAAIFEEIEALGTQVFVIPGNHDVANGWARAFVQDKQVVTRQVTRADFERLFSRYGFSEAYSRDASSLSYVVAFDNFRLLMLDSNTYSPHKGQGAPVTNGRLTQETLSWLEGQLAEAKEQALPVLPVMHHNVLKHHPGHTYGYTLDNASDLWRLYDQYGVPIALSGHIHTQHSKQERLTQTTLTEIVTGAFSVTPMPIGRLRLSEDRLTYIQTPLDMASWAKQKQEERPELVAHAQYLADLFAQDTDRFVHRVLNDEGWYDKALADDLAALVMPLNQSYFAGERLEADVLSELLENPAYLILQQEHSNSLLKRYIDLIIDEGQVSHQHLTLDW